MSVRAFVCSLTPGRRGACLSPASVVSCPSLEEGGMEKRGGGKMSKEFFQHHCRTQSRKGWNRTTDEKAACSSGAVDRYYGAGGSMNVVQDAVLTAAEVNLGEIKQCFCV